MTFYQIATDGGLVRAPISMNRLRLSPGERAEILVDLPECKVKQLTNELRQWIPGWNSWCSKCWTWE
ncbi:MAG: hypothetical protein IPN61_09775 [Bacteroidetes bacterium]|nr:hypothetical protein [Bacteroidota bacterium]